MPTFAPVYTDGPVPLPGDEPEFAIVAGVDGRPVVVPTITPGAVIAFPAGDAKPPKEIYVQAQARSSSSPARIAAIGVSSR